MQSCYQVWRPAVIDFFDRAPIDPGWERTPLTEASRRFQKAIIAGLELDIEPDANFIHRLLSHPEIVDDRTVVYMQRVDGLHICYRATSAHDPHIYSFARLISAHNLSKPTTFSNGCERALLQVFGRYIVIVREAEEQ